MDILQKVTDKIKERVRDKDPEVSIDIITILTIVNILYELYKAIMSLYFPKSDEEIVRRLKNPNAVTRLMFRREIVKQTKLNLQSSKGIKDSIVDVLNSYSDEEVLLLLKKVKEQKHER